VNSIRWGILGPGGIAATFVSDLQGAEKQGYPLRVTAVGSRDGASAEEFAARFGIARAHAGYEALVADPEVDAVYVATPHVFHREQALLAIAAGKHVLVEKPFAVNAAEARDIFDAAEAAGVVALEAMWTRFLPQTTHLHEVIASGVIGEPRLFTGTHAQNLPTDPRHRINDPALGGGALLDLGVYPVAFALDVLGAPTGVHASAVLSDQGVDARVSALLEHEGGARSMLYSALDLRMSNSAVLAGTTGRIDIDATFFTPSGFTVYDTDDVVVERYDADEHGLRGMHHQALELARVVADGWEGSPLTPADTIAVATTMDEIRRQIGVRYPSEVA
jgi:predicted dehydrogenase